MSFLPSWAQSCTSLAKRSSYCSLEGPSQPGRLVPQQLRWGTGRGSHWALRVPFVYLFIMIF